MPATGPVPKRSDQRRRRNVPEVTPTSAPGAAVVVAPAPSDDWHPIARAWYDSLSESGQSRFYEPSDYALAFMLAESISMDLKPQFVGFRQVARDETEAEYAVVPLKGASLSAYLRAMGSLLVTEGDRRRASLELQRGSQVDEHELSAVTELDAFRARQSG